MNKVLLASLAVMVSFASCSDTNDHSLDTTTTKESSETLQISDSEIKITLKDYLEEAASIQAEAQDIIKRAEEIKCTDAKKLAENVLLVINKAKVQTTLIRFEHFIEEASQALADSEDAIIYCEEKNEISYAVENIENE